MKQHSNWIIKSGMYPSIEANPLIRVLLTHSLQ